MQANCPQCAQRIVIDDAKVPDRPFNVKCPKCQTTVKFPGKGAAPVNADAAVPGEVPSVPPPPGPAGTEEVRAQVMAQIRREMTLGAVAEGSSGRALVCLQDRGLAGAFALLLTRQGYAVDTVEDWEEAGRLLEQGLFAVVVTARVAAPAGKGESLYQRFGRLSPDTRRRIFLIVTGEEFKSGDGLQAFTVLADLALHPKDVATADTLLRNTLQERARVFQAYLDARHRFEAASGY